MKLAPNSKSLAILGAGKLGITVAQLALKAGYTVYIAGSGSPEKIRLSVGVLAPEAIALSTADAIHEAEVIVLALPLSKYQSIPQANLSGKLVIDAMNYWWEVDGANEAFRGPATSTSELVQSYFSSSRVVKALSHVGYHHLSDEAKLPNTLGRKAVAIAGDNPEDCDKVAQLVDDLGFDPLVIGKLAAGKQLEPGSPAFGANLNLTDLQKLLN